MSSPVRLPVRKVEIDVCATKFAAALLVTEWAQKEKYAGVRLRPSPQGGVVIEATDGKLFVCFHDPEGSVSAEATVRALPDLALLLNPLEAVRVETEERDGIEIDIIDGPQILMCWRQPRLKGVVTDADSVVTIEGVPTPCGHGAAMGAGYARLVLKVWPDALSLLTPPGPPTVPTVKLSRVYLRLLTEVDDRLYPTAISSALRFTGPASPDMPWVIQFQNVAHGFALLRPRPADEEAADAPEAIDSLIEGVPAWAALVQAEGGAA